MPAEPYVLKANAGKDLELHLNASSKLTQNSLTSNQDFSISVLEGKKLNLDIPVGATLMIGDGAVSTLQDGGFTNKWMRVLIGGTYYKVPLMNDSQYDINNTIVPNNILLLLNNTNLTSSDEVTLLLGKEEISYIGHYEYWGQTTQATYITSPISYLKLTSFNYIGWDFPPIDFTNNNVLDGSISFNFWTNVNLIINLKFVNTNIKNGNGVSTEYGFNIEIIPGSWNNTILYLNQSSFLAGNNSVPKVDVFKGITQIVLGNVSNTTSNLNLMYLTLKRTGL